ncbi:MAG: alpha/beta fold hydrolase [Candidatus Binataceae bacterium]|nr:alpha/beta fold hydrolase [Candidatus Binataceae bacterium]
MPTKYWEVSDRAIYLHYAGATTLPGVPPDLSRGRKLLFIHAAGSNGHNWHHQIDHLGRTHSPLAFDFPGHGRSTGTEGLASIREYSDFVVAIADALSLTTFVIAGRAMGSIIALDVAARYPHLVEALVLISATAKLNLSSERLSGLQAVASGRVSQAFTNDGFARATIEKQPDVIRESWMEQIKTDPRVRYTDLLACVQTDLRGDITKVRQPTLLIAGAEDQVTTPADAEFIAGKISGARVRIIADAAHNSPIERPAEVNAAIDNFLAELR